MTTPVDATVKLVAFKVPDELKSTPAVPEFKATVVAARLPVALIPPAASDAERVKDVPELAASWTTPTNVSLTLTMPVASAIVMLVAFSDPAVLKSIPPVPALKLVVAEARAPVAFIPPATFEAFKVKVEPELAAS